MAGCRAGGFRLARAAVAVAGLLLVAVGSPVFAQALLGDLNHDGNVDAADLAIFLQQWRLMKGGQSWDPDASLNGDAALDRTDIGLMLGGVITHPTSTNATGTVQFPAGFPLSTGQVRVAGSMGTSPVGTDGSFAVPEWGPGQAQVFLVDAADEPILCGFADTAVPGGGLINTRTTAATLLFYAVGAFLVPQDYWPDMQALVSDSPQAARLASVIATRVAANPHAIVDADTQLTNSLADEALSMGPISGTTGPTQVRPAEAPATTPGAVKVEPQGPISGVGIEACTDSTGIKISNTFRRHLQYYIYRTGWENAEGQLTSLNPWVADYAPSLGNFCYLQAVNGLSGAIGTIVDLLVGGMVPYATSYTEMIPLRRNPSDAAKTHYQVIVLGSAWTANSFESYVPGELASYIPAWKNTYQVMDGLTFVQEVFLPVLFACLPVENIGKMLPGDQMAVLAQDILDTLTDHGFDLSEQIATGHWRNAVGVACRGIAGDRALQLRIIDLIVQKGLMRGKPFEITVKVGAKIASYIMLIDKLMTATDVGIMTSQLVSASAFVNYHVTIVKPDIRIQPEPVATVAAGNEISLLCTYGSLGGDIMFDWVLADGLGLIRDSHGRGGPMLLTRDSTVTYKAPDAVPASTTQDITCEILLTENGKEISLGTGKTTLKIDPSAVTLSPSLSKVSRGGVVRYTVTVGQPPATRWYHWTTVGNYGTLRETNTGGLVGNDFWSTSRIVEYVAHPAAPGKGQEHVKLSVHPYSDRNQYIGAADALLSLSATRVFLVPDVLRAPGNWGTSYTNVYVAVAGDGLSTAREYTWSCGGILYLEDSQNVVHTSPYTTTDRFTYPHLPDPTTDGVVWGVQCSVAVEAADRTMKTIGVANGFVGYFSNVACNVISGSAGGYPGVTSTNAWLEFGRDYAVQAPNCGALLPGAGWVLYDLRKGELLVFSMYAKSIPAGQTTAEVGHGPIYISKTCDLGSPTVKLSDSVSVMLGNGQRYYQVFNVPAFP